MKTRTSLNSRERRFDYFISYPRPDEALALSVADDLGSYGRVFIACRDILPGEDGYTRIPQTIRDSWVTIAIITDATQDAIYQRDELVQAIAFSREMSSLHRIVPLLKLGGTVPFGLNTIIPLDIDDGTSEKVRRHLDVIVSTRDDLRSQAGHGWRIADGRASREQQSLERVASFRQLGLVDDVVAQEFQRELLKRYL
jgi:hypothetical protein